MQVKLILKAKDIPDNTVVMKKTGEKMYGILSNFSLVAYIEDTGGKLESKLDIPKGYRILIDSYNKHAPLSLVSGDTELVCILEEREAIDLIEELSMEEE